MIIKGLKFYKNYEFHDAEIIIIIIIIIVGMLETICAGEVSVRRGLSVFNVFSLVLYF